ncbi:MAG: DEAD/DEAH box helicase [Ruminococcus sp.]|nr:DEAD/DEAH box helicase [Ruminococcus sp.]
MEYPRIKTCIDTSVDDFISELYTPCFKWAERLDRGVGYFTSGWLEYNISGLSDFASRGGKIRLITSPILSNIDSDAIIASESASDDYSKFENALNNSVAALEREMKADILNAFSWMLYDGIIELKFAIPCEKLSDGNFHDKFGIFYKGTEALSFSGSINDSKHGFANYESLKVFKTWAGTVEYVEADILRFEKLWHGQDKNLKIYNIPTAIKERIFTLRSSDRPYKNTSAPANKWEHQDKAVDCFLEKEHGILAMATGTGKTITAIKIMTKLFEDNRIKRVVITMYGNDLLDQWAKQMREKFSDKQIYCHYNSQKAMNKFIMHPDNSILLISRDANNLVKLLDVLDKAPGNYKNDTLFLFDEVHGAGSGSLVENLAGRISPYRYRLGLSATPEREYDDDGNDFLLNEIGEVIFEFSLQDAIRKGILCEFNYIPLPYELTEAEKQKKKKIIAAFNTKKENGEDVDESELYTQLSLVNKTAINKIDGFESFISEHPELLEKSIIFVQTMDYGLLLQPVLMKYTNKYHTYYADDEKINLENFADGKIDCLLTCKKVSEGIDISSVTNIFLFASDRSRLVTTQRIGRALRLDKNNPDKVANVIDFIIEDNESDNNSDQERADWLSELAKTRRENDE